MCQVNVEGWLFASKSDPRVNPFRCRQMLDVAFKYDQAPGVIENTERNYQSSQHSEKKQSTRDVSQSPKWRRRSG